jgi:prevent-host-death family protein
MNEQVGLREMRQGASELVRRVEGGEEFVVTVSGRPAARLVPIRRMRWRSGQEVGYIFKTPADPAWQEEHAARSDALDDATQDPWPTG